jgi:1-acyl-sn-glycerol-3-phosphate acyltransferase
MNAFDTMLGGAHDPARAKTSPYRGWRVSVNRVIWRAFVLTVGTLVIWAEKVFPGRGYGLRLFASTSRVTNRLLGVRVEVVERSKLVPGQAYVTPNHRSHIDMTAAAATLPGVRFAGKRELFAEPILGAAMRALGMIPIDREDPAAAKRALDAAAAKFGREVSLVIFPEDTRAPARCMLPFKGGLWRWRLLRPRAFSDSPTLRLEKRYYQEAAKDG